MSRSIILSLILGALLGSCYLLPKAGDTAESALSLDPPATLGGWTLTKLDPSDDEKRILSPDTVFCKRQCLRKHPSDFSIIDEETKDELDLSIVLSGHDVNNSIHRPERCMPAQGHDITSSSDVPIQLKNGKTISMKRLLSRQTTWLDKEHKHPITLNAVSYYVFVGHDRITDSHYWRTFIDMKDRVLHGEDQRWAYLTVSMRYGKAPEDLARAAAELPWLPKDENVEDADKKIRQFIVELADRQVDWSQIKN